MRVGRPKKQQDEGKRPLEETFDALLDIEELLDKLKHNRSGKVALTGTKGNIKLFETVVANLRSRMMTSYKSAQANREFRLPDSKLGRKTLADRKLRERKSEQLYARIQHYLEDFETE